MGVHYKHKTRDCGFGILPKYGWRVMALDEDHYMHYRNLATVLVNSVLQFPDIISSFLGTNSWTTEMYFLSIKCKLKMQRAHYEARTQTLANDPNKDNRLITLQRDFWLLSTEEFLHYESRPALKATCMRLNHRMRRRGVRPCPIFGQPDYDSDADPGHPKNFWARLTPNYDDSSPEDSAWLCNYYDCHPYSCRLESPESLQPASGHTS
jgi:hypothetical protein